MARVQRFRAKAPEVWRTPQPGGLRTGLEHREASWTAAPPRRFWFLRPRSEPLGLEVIMQRSTKTAFTLIELLVVITIFAILAGM